MREENHPTEHKGHPAALHQQAGFSLLELLIAMTIFAIATGAIYGLLEVARADRFTTNQRVEILQSVRNSLNAIGRDTLNAGYEYPNRGALLPNDALFTVLGLPYVTGAIPDSLTPVVSGDNINPNAINPIVGTNTDQITFAFVDVSFNNLGPDGIVGTGDELNTGQPVAITSTANTAANGDQVAINDPGADGVVGTLDDLTNNICATNDIYLIRSQSSEVIGMMTATPAGADINFAGADPLNINDPGAGNLIANAIIVSGVPIPATLSRVTWVTYRVLNDGTLVRTVHGGSAAGSQDMPLAYGIEDMQIQYVLTDGTTVNDPVAGPNGVTGNADDTPANLQNVRQVRVTITARSSERDLRNNQLFRITLTSIFNTRNLGY